MDHNIQTSNTTTDHTELKQIQTNGTRGLDLQQIQTSLANLLANSKKVYVPSFERLTGADRSLPLQALKNQGFEKACFALPVKNRHWIACSVDLTTQPYQITLMNSEVDNSQELKKEITQLLTRLFDPMDPFYCVFKESPYESQSDDWSCGVFVIAHLLHLNNHETINKNRVLNVEKKLKEYLQTSHNNGADQLIEILKKYGNQFNLLIDYITQKEFSLSSALQNLPNKHPIDKLILQVACFYKNDPTSFQLKLEKIIKLIVHNAKKAYDNKYKDLLELELNFFIAANQNELNKLVDTIINADEKTALPAFLEKIDCSHYLNELNKAINDKELLHLLLIQISLDGFFGLEINKRNEFNRFDKEKVVFDGALKIRIANIKEIFNKCDISHLTDDLLNQLASNTSCYHFIMKFVNRDYLKSLTADQKVNKLKDIAKLKNVLRIDWYFAIKFYPGNLKNFLIEHKDKIAAVDTLHVAAEAGDVVIVEKLLEIFPVDLKTEAKETPLMFACYQGNNAVLQLLLNHKANIHLKNEEGEDALMIAANTFSKDAVKTLLEEKADADSVDKNGETALMRNMPAEFHLRHSVSDRKKLAQEHLEIARMLISHTSNMNYISPKKKSALSLAVEFGCVEIVKFLLSKGANPNQSVYWKGFDSASPLMVAVIDTCWIIPEADREQIIKLLIRYGANPNQRFVDDVIPYIKTTILKAMMDDNEPAPRIKLLLELGAKVTLNDIESNIDRNHRERAILYLFIHAEKFPAGSLSFARNSQINKIFNEFKLFLKELIQDNKPHEARRYLRDVLSVNNALGQLLNKHPLNFFGRDYFAELKRECGDWYHYRVVKESCFQIS